MSTQVHILSPRLAAACTAVLALAACDRFAQPPAAAPDTAELELAWARAALERNPNIEVVASDAQGRVFTIRDKRTGEVQVAPLDQLAAAPVAALKATPVRAPIVATEPAPEAVAAPGATPARTSTSTASEPAQTAATAAPAPLPPQSTSSDAGYTIERNAGQLRVTGPGVSIVSSGQASTSAQANNGTRTSEPIICEGRRMLHFDNREIFVDGDAITVRDGCELFITNSRIVASGIGVTVQNGTVHVSNSHIEGAQGSFEANAEAKMYVRGSTFQGLPRRDALAMVQDQGGNRWR